MATFVPSYERTTMNDFGRKATHIQNSHMLSERNIGSCMCMCAGIYVLSNMQNIMNTEQKSTAQKKIIKINNYLKF